MLCWSLAKKFMDNRVVITPKNFVGEPFSVSLISGIGKILCFRGLCHDFPSKIFCLTVPKHFVEEPFYAVFQKTSASEKIYG